MSNLSRTQLMINKIEQIVCEHLNVSVTNTRSQLRTYDLTQARHVIWYLLNTFEFIDRKVIAKEYNHGASNVNWAINKISDHVQANKAFRMLVKEIKFKINPGLWVKELGKPVQL